MGAATVRIVDFLQARIDEDMRTARSAYEPILTSRFLREAQAKEAILDRHRGEVWNIPIDNPSWEWDYVVTPDYVEANHYKDWRLNRTLTWEQYHTEIGATRVIAPELIALARIYSDHPDYQEDWTE
jgi:hypothetical protein